MVTYKRLPLSGLENCRDLGGYPVAGGGVTRYGVYLRSELPEHMTESDIDMLRRYGVTLSVDLRGDKEIDREPSDLRSCPGITYYHLPMFNEQAAAGSESSRKEKKAPDPGKFPDWDIAYISMLEDHKGWTAAMLKLMAEAEGCVHFHCFTGKDRTGLCAALLLSIAGVDESDIVADYSLSMSYLPRRYAKLQRMFEPNPTARPNLIDGFFSTSPMYMQRVLDHLTAEYGSVLGYIRACGVDEATITAIREKLVDYPEG